MKEDRFLFWNAFLISFKHSGRRLLCLFCVALLCATLLAVLFQAAAGRDPVRRARVGVVNLDKNPLSISMMNTLLEGENLSELIEVTALPASGEGRENCTAVITVPNGFLESILNGENLPPVVELNAQSPLEAMWVRQLALAGARALSAAQIGVYAVLDAADYGAEMEQRAYGLLVMDVNLALLNAFFDRLLLLDVQKLSVSGLLTLTQYYICALAAALLFCYGFLFQPAVENLRCFARVAGHRGALFLAAWVHVIVWNALALLPLFWLFCGGPPSGLVAEWLLLALLAGNAAMLLALLFRNRGVCAAACLLLTLGQALCGGLIVPLALLPAEFSAAAPFLPVWQGMHLLGAAFGEAAGYGVPLAMVALLAAGAALLWTARGRRT